MEQSKTDQTKTTKFSAFREPLRNDLSKSGVWVESGNFYGGKSGGAAFLVVGFDSEYKSPEAAQTRAQLKAGGGINEVISYQYHCKLYDDQQPDAHEWGAILYPEKGERLSMADLLAHAFAKGIAENAVSILPTKIYMVGHFTRADMPSFSDFKAATHLMSAVRNSFLTVESDIPVELTYPGQDAICLSVALRDTSLLSPTGLKSLKTLGELVGEPKVVLDPDPVVEQHYKSNMNELLRDNRELFERYALTDAVICVRYADEVIKQREELIGDRKIPVTLTGMGVDLLMQIWGETLGTEVPELLGKEVHLTKVWNNRIGRYSRKKVEIPIEAVALHLTLAEESYHGGRNEQFWFGPAFEDAWTDYDLSGAYPTAMALIQTPDWKRTYISLNVEDFTERTLGVAHVTFEFPASVRFPTMPVRTANGLIFPLRGTTTCGAPEIALAARLGAKLTISYGVIVPYKNTDTVFGPFISHCARERTNEPKGSFRNLFWKELSNSSYGKTAQGLRKKRVYDLRDRNTKPLPASKITNAFFASYITSFVRSALGEIMNALPSSVCVFSCTTDGFLTNATDSEMEQASQGVLASIFKESRQALTGESTLLEIKHECRQPLGWRTRGQATLIPGDSSKDDYNVVLAKGGIWTKSSLDTVASQNDHILKRFFNRTPESIIDLKVMTGIRDMVELDADLVEKALTRRLNMEFDWKRRPHATSTSLAYDHVAFSTVPWETVEQFESIRGYWEELTSHTPFCMKAMADYDRFALHVLSKTSVGRVDARYMRAADPDIMLCSGLQN